MAWATKLKPDEEIIIGDKTVIRTEDGRTAHIRISDCGAPPRLKVMKRKIGAADE